MATNLRLGETTATALREAAVRSGKSQQQLLREAVDAYLGLETIDERARARRSGIVRAGTPFVDVEPTVHLPAGQSSRDLMDRTDDDR